MLYFSEVKGKKIITEDGIYVGSLKDFIFRATDHPAITKMVINSPHNSKLIVPISYLMKVNSKILISKQYQSTNLEENELYVLKNLLDKQIIDLQGNKIVRVNDVVIQDRPSFYIGGVDIGLLGILRWLKLEHVIFNFFQVIGIRLTSHFLSWGDIQPLELARGRVKLKKEEEKLEKIPPEDLADHLEKTNIRNIKRILHILHHKYAAEVIANLNINYQTALFKQLSINDIVKIVPLLDPDEAVDILLTLSPKKRETVLGMVDPKVTKQLNYLLNLSTTPIGEMMTTEFLTVNPKTTVRETINAIKKNTSDYNFFTYVYVVNQNNELVGVFNLHELLMQQLDAVVYKFMTQNVVVVHLTTPKEIAIYKMLKYQLFALPVIDKNKHVLGIITLDDVGDELLKKM